ncbi:MAG: DEAD/DEAH box helicase [candidate division WOR-3 bacterium]
MTGLPESLAEQSLIRASLTRTWIPFFSRFGRLTEVQVQAIPRILAGRNLVVISPAASGKTEAVVAPVIERVLADARGQRPGARHLAVLYVSPTRALVNDLYRRLAGPLEYLGLTLDRKTGDHPALNESRPPFMLLTTPESFDSLLCRHPRIFQELKAVILDELHLLDNTPRGDQLRVLLERLRLITVSDRSGTETKLRYYALSATIDDLGIGSRYFPEPDVVHVPSRREIEHVLIKLTEDWPGRVIAELRKRDCQKVLCFFNARSLVEAAVRALNRPPFQDRVWVHHASLTRQVREQVEAQMNRERTGLLCCTSTLELGIDIGDIDAVVLVRPPFNVSSLLQRIGRGNRRRPAYLFAIGLYRDSWERLLFETFLDCAQEGRLYEKRYTPSLSIIPQQIISYLFQRRRIGTTLESVKRVLLPVIGNEPVIEQVFRHLIDQGVIQAGRSGIYFLTDKLEQKIESGKIHSNIQEKSFGQFEVWDVTTGRHVGTVFYEQPYFVLAGRSWEVVERMPKEKRLMVRPRATVAPSTKVFEGTGTGGYSYRMAEVLKARLFPGLKPGEFPCFEEDGLTYFVHLLGATYGGLLAEALNREKLDATDMGGKVLVLPTSQVGEPVRTFPVPSRRALREVVSANILRLEDHLGSGAFFRLLPRELQIEDHLLTLDVQGLADFLTGLELVRMAPAAVAGQIAEHLRLEE